ncbi:TadE/TadG family type IV pilus assembly protein [Nocardioides sp. C4-1]|uniref:TadE/TadG family type IV pilus assembly protein n=1 Tax=Nocardioides sp. C4-1 TaxID=3151851 RepID=UPI003265142F
MLASLARRRDDRGASSVELVMYTPLLMFVIFLAVQFSLVYLGNQAASAVARETARAVRVSEGDQGRGRSVGMQYAGNIGGGVLEDVDIQIQLLDGGTRVRVTVSGRAQEISPVGVPRVSETIEGPIERFVQGAP